MVLRHCVYIILYITFNFKCMFNVHQFSSVQSLSRVWLFATSWIAAGQASLSITNSRSSLRLMSIESVMPPSHLILCRPLILLPSIFPSIREKHHFFSESVLHISSVQFSSVHFSRSVVSDSLPPHESQHTRPPCPPPSPRVHSDSCPSSPWCHPAISSSVIPFSSCLQSFPASGSFPVSQLFASGGQSIGASASASVLPMNIQDWFPLEWTCWISLLSQGLSRVFSNTTVQKHQFFSAHLSLWSNSSHLYITTGKNIALTRWTFVSKVMSLLFHMLCWS